jgi:hypothetical protein
MEEILGGRFVAGPRTGMAVRAAIKLFGDAPRGALPGPVLPAPFPMPFGGPFGIPEVTVFDDNSPAFFKFNCGGGFETIVGCGSFVAAETHIVSALSPAFAMFLAAGMLGARWLWRKRVASRRASRIPPAGRPLLFMRARSATYSLDWLPGPSTRRTCDEAPLRNDPNRRHRARPPHLGQSCAGNTGDVPACPDGSGHAVVYRRRAAERQVCE